MRIDAGDDVREVSGHGTLQTAAEQRVDEDIGCRIECSRPAFDGTAGRQEIAAGCRRVARQRICVDGRDSGHVDARSTREPGDDVAVTAVIPRATDDLVAPGIGIVLPDHAKRRFAGATHQRVAGNSGAIDRMAIDLPYRSNWSGDDCKRPDGLRRSESEDY